MEDLEEVTKKYFSFYKINALNFETADLTYFKVPLLLDLFCKLINEARLVEKEIKLDIKSYLQVFENYIQSLIAEVQKKLNLQKSRPISEGLSESSAKFLANNEAIIPVDDFSDAFDKDDSVKQDQSIARAVLEGYLIFVKDMVGSNKEIVKHTQQEVGGYLLAKKFLEKYGSISELLNSDDFKYKIIGSDTTKHHQLRWDILKFLIAFRPEIIPNIKGREGLILSWWYIFNGFDGKHSSISDFLVNTGESKLIVENILDVSFNHWFDPVSIFNFNFISEFLRKLQLWEFEANWTFYIYNEIDFFYQFVEDSIERIKTNIESKQEYEFLVAKIISYITATTIRELRDLATIYLIEFGKLYPISLLEITEQSATLIDIYIYERLASSCYGVALIKQNDSEYISRDLPVIARRLFNLQFSDNPSAPVYNYIVIDSIKHLLDLSVFKKVATFTEDEARRFANYDFIPPYEWISPTKEQLKLINLSSQMSWPEPIGMDFGIYTIPRLMIKNHVDDRKAIANVYKAVFELGYKDLEKQEFTDERFRKFYWGGSIRSFKGKIDRLGKKYSWKGFFDYAGYLLLNKKLNVFEKDDSAKTHYVRLGDVDIDICLPNINYKLKRRLYNENLLSHRETNPKWYDVSLIDSITPLFESCFDNENYVMLYGKIDQRLDDSYNVRSFLLAESFLITRDSQIENLRLATADKNFDWKEDVHFFVDRIRHAYFGELYWADSFYESKPTTVDIPTGETKKFIRKIKFQDIIQFDGYSQEDIGKEVEEIRPEKLFFESEPTLAEYLWESDSEVLNGFGEYFPSLKMGKYLGLRTEPNTGKILDENLCECYKCVDYEDKNYFSNTFNYIRIDLLRKYMSENNLVLIYQVKQHSYDQNREHNRGMKFYIFE